MEALVSGLSSRVSAQLGLGLSQRWGSVWGQFSRVRAGLGLRLSRDRGAQPRDPLSRPGPQIQYNGLTLDVDGRTTKKLITHLKPNTFYNFVLTNRGSSLGGLQQTVTAWTAFNLLSGKPSVAPKPDTDGFIMVYLPDGQSPVPVQYA